MGIAILNSACMASQFDLAELDLTPPLIGMRMLFLSPLHLVVQPSTLPMVMTTMLLSMSAFLLVMTTQ